MTHSPPGGRAVAGRGDGSEVLRGLVGRPVVRLRFVDAHHLYVNWVWNHQPHLPRTTAIPREAVAPALDALRRALPTPIAGETGAEALERALSGGVLLDARREQELATSLTAALMPQWLALELNALEVAGHRPHVRVQASPSTVQVPWALIGTHERERGVDMFDMSVLLPASLRNDPARRVSPWRPGAAVVGVLDPAVPGAPPDGELGSVLGPVTPGSGLARMVDGWGARARPRMLDSREAFRRRDLDRVALSALLGEDASSEAAPGRLLYVGHVTGSTHALDTRMHLADGADSPGLVDVVGRHRPLSAADIALGSPGVPALRAPNRVALVACDSGGEARFAEPTGLVAAFAHRGAEHITATQWTLPTEAGLRRFARELGDRAEGMLADAIVAVDAVHEADDPIAALGAWQREQRRRWTETGDPRHSPIIWGAFTTAWAPPPSEPTSPPQ